MSRRSGVLVLVVLFSAFTLFLKLPSLRFAHDEPDELVYWDVARNLVEHGAYTLQGAPIRGRLSPSIYDRPLFHHPPLYPLLLTPFVALEARQAAVVVSWLGHLLCVVSVGMIGGALLAAGRPVGNVLWLALLGVATDPLLAHVSRKLWIDSLLAGLVALALGLVWVALVSIHRRRCLLLAGVVLGLAGLAKLPGLLALPVAATLVWGGGGSRRERLRDLLLVAVPCALLVLPWLAVFVSTYGVLLPTWLKPDENALQRFPFLAVAVGRPWYFYAVKVALSQPLAIVCLALSFRPRPGEFARWAAPLWFFLWLVVTTVQSAGGYGFQMRYLAPLAPSLYAMLLSLRSPRGFVRPVIAVAIAYSAIGSAPYLLTETFDELLSFLELGGLVRL